MQKIPSLIIATGTYPPEISGQANFVYNLRQRLLAIKPSLQIKVISYGQDNMVSEPASVFFIKRTALRYLKYLFTLYKISKEAGIIFAQDLVSSGLPSALLKNRCNKMVLRLGGDFLWEKVFNSGKTKLRLSAYYNQPKSLKERIYLIIYRFVLGRSDIIIFTSHLQARIYKNFFRLSTEKIKIITNPLEVSFKAPANLKKNNEIIFAGRFIPLKNLTRLIEAFRQLNTNKKLVLIGDGPQKEALLKLTAADSNISIEGPLSQKKLWQRLARAYLVVLPSITELSPNIALEALALQIPVVLTKENGLPEKIKIYFKLIDPFSTHDIQSALRFFLDQNNYQYWRKNLAGLSLDDFSWSKVLAAYLKILAF